ncbi:MAG: phosphodiester glycosidase family protein [Deltaproteobacteria bacterium]|nr:phosphodiester glycosidase family protein [Deltaproteobacteria bacterium]
MARTVAVLAAASVVACLAIAPSAARAADAWSDPFPGVRRLDRTTSTPWEIHALVVNLCAAGVRLRATAPSEGSRVTSSFGALVGAEAAINGDFYASGTPIGLAIGNGTRWTKTADSGGHGFIAFGPEQAAISFPPEVVATPPSWMREVVGGNVPLVVGGAPNTGDTGSFCTTRHPRTMVGLSADRGTLYLAVVDGRSSRSVGMRCDEMALFMKELGAHDALNLDGGGSTTMWVKGAGVINRPSDGSERTVVNHLALYAKGTGESWSCNAAPRGYLDTAACEGIGGWAQDPSVPATPIDVHVYIGGPAGDPAARSFSVRADLERADLCAPLGSCNHAFLARVPPMFQDDVARPVFAYGIDASGGRNTQLVGAPKTLKCGPRPPVATTSGVKRHVTSPAVLGAWRFSDTSIARVSDELLKSYPTGPTLPEKPELLQAEGKPEVYVRDFGARRHVPSPTALADWNLPVAEIEKVPASEIDRLLPGAPTPAFPYLVRGSGPEVYVLDAPPPLGAELVAYEAPAQIAPGARATVTVRLRNRGSMAWESGKVGIAPVEPRDHDSVLCDPETWSSCRRAASVEATTKPGDVGVFRFTIRAPAEPGSVRECWSLHAAAASGDLHWSGDPGQWGPKDAELCRDVGVSVDAPSDGGIYGSRGADGDLTGACACRTRSERGALGGFALAAALGGVLVLLRRRVR